MGSFSLEVGKDLCEGCALALRRFIGHMEGVEDVGVENGKVVVSFDGEVADEFELMKISKESIEKLGYKAEQ